jgi:GT2 family glycosyltransferase
LSWKETKKVAGGVGKGRVIRQTGVMQTGGDGHSHSGPLAVSVVVPTFNRLERLRRVLAALAAQTYGGAMEIIVVSDGSTDGTDDYLRSGDVPAAVRAVFQPNGGPAAARNHGVAEARGMLVVFIDDDVIAAADLVEHHVASHAAQAHDVVVVGPMLTPSDARLSPWVAWEQDMLYKQYDRLAAGTMTATHRQFYTGNASVPRHLLVEVGGFDVSFRRGEDLELAARLAAKGVGFVFDADARAYHYAERSWASWVSTAYDYGVNDVAFWRGGQSDMLRRIAADFRSRHLLQRIVVRIVLSHRRLAAASVVVLRSCAMAAARCRLRTVSRQALSALYGIRYYSGVAAGLGSHSALRAVLDGAEPIDQSI